MALEARSIDRPSSGAGVFQIRRRDGRWDYMEDREETLRRAARLADDLGSTLRELVEQIAAPDDQRGADEDPSITELHRRVRARVKAEPVNDVFLRMSIDRAAGSITEG
jgi:hypothetical protein